MCVLDLESNVETQKTGGKEKLSILPVYVFSSMQTSPTQLVKCSHWNAYPCSHRYAYHVYPGMRSSMMLLAAVSPQSVNTGTHTHVHTGMHPGFVFLGMHTSKMMLVAVSPKVLTPARISMFSPECMPRYMNPGMHTPVRIPRSHVCAPAPCYLNMFPPKCNTGMYTHINTGTRSQIHTPALYCW